MKTLFSAPYWPQSSDPPTVRVEVSLDDEDTDERDVAFSLEVRDFRGVMTGLSGSVRREVNLSPPSAKEVDEMQLSIAVLYKAVDHLAQELANEKAKKR